MEAKDWTWETLYEGAKAEFEHCVSADEVRAFAAVSGDHNPLHVNPTYARDAGHPDTVVHGALLAGLVSRLVGMELPGRRSFLLNLKLSFAAPTYPEDALLVQGAVQSMHEDQRVIALRVRIACGDELRARGTALVRVED